MKNNYGIVAKTKCSRGKVMEKCFSAWVVSGGWGGEENWHLTEQCFTVWRLVSSPLELGMKMRGNYLYKRTKRTG